MVLSGVFMRLQSLQATVLEDRTQAMLEASAVVCHRPIMSSLSKRSPPNQRFGRFGESLRLEGPCAVRRHSHKAACIVRMRALRNCMCSKAADLSGCPQLFEWCSCTPPPSDWHIAVVFKAFILMVVCDEEHSFAPKLGTPSPRI